MFNTSSHQEQSEEDDQIIEPPNNFSSSEKSSNSRKGRDQILAEYEVEEEDLSKSMEYYSRLKSRAAEFMNVIATIEIQVTDLVHYFMY